MRVSVQRSWAARGWGCDVLAEHAARVPCRAQDNEAFLHRSGRTGRAGKTGTAIVMFTEREARALGLILKTTKARSARDSCATAPRTPARCQRGAAFRSGRRAGPKRW